LGAEKLPHVRATATPNPTAAPKVPGARLIAWSMIWEERASNARGIPLSRRCSGEADEELGSCWPRSASSLFGWEPGAGVVGEVFGGARRRDGWWWWVNCGCGC
jgi:hypothetical protein